MGLLMARKNGVKLVDSIQAALCYDAATGEVGSELAVDGILAIGEHGSYPANAKGQILYPRRHFWEQITGVLATSEQRHACPIFSECPLALPFPALPSLAHVARQRTSTSLSPGKTRCTSTTRGRSWG